MSYSAAKKKTALLAGAGIALALSLLLAWASFHPRALESVKTVTVNIVHADGAAESREWKTTARTLLEAMAPEIPLETCPTEYGTAFLSVMGEYTAAGYSWVCAANSQEYVMDAAAYPLEDGDVFDLFILADAY